MLKILFSDLMTWENLWQRHPEILETETQSSIFCLWYKDRKKRLYGVPSFHGGLATRSDLQHSTLLVQCHLMVIMDIEMLQIIFYVYPQYQNHSTG